MQPRATPGERPSHRDLPGAAGDSQQGPRAHGSRTAFLGYGACALAGGLWGTGFYWGRLAMNVMSVEHMVLYRFLFACLGMLPVVIANRNRFHLTRGETSTL